MTPTVSGRFAFRASPEDLKNIEAVALAMREAGHPFCTRTDALRLSLAAAAANLGSIVAGGRK
jgi:hypothetical protein